MTEHSEKDLDRALEDALCGRPEFATWFLNQTTFAGRPASCVFSRSNHPWSKSPIEILNAETGVRETVIREGETDILVVFETVDKRRFALHIENKRAAGHFTPLQPQLYAARAAHWRGLPHYGAYDEWETVLVAPKSFYNRFSKAAKEFDRFVSHEDISAFIPEFGKEC